MQLISELPHQPPWLPHHLYRNHCTFFLFFFCCCCSCPSLVANHNNCLKVYLPINILICSYAPRPLVNPLEYLILLQHLLKMEPGHLFHPLQLRPSLPPAALLLPQLTQQIVARRSPVPVKELFPTIRPPLCLRLHSVLTGHSRWSVRC